MELSEKIDALLSQVEKPVRYMGGEFGSVMKDLGTVDVRYAFLFPDVYEVGMSHLGMKILYHAINRMDGAWCERVFSPWVDMDAKMREAGVPLFSLESRTPVRESTPRGPFSSPIRCPASTSKPGFFSTNALITILSIPFLRCRGFPKKVEDRKSIGQVFDFIVT